MRDLGCGLIALVLLAIGAILAYGAVMDLR